MPDELTARRLVAARAARRARCASSCRGPTSTARCARRASRAHWGALLEAGVADLRVPADDVPLQGDGGRRPVDVGGLDQLRQPLLPPQRRGQPQRLRRGASRRSRRAMFERDLRARRRITLQEWRERPRWERVKEWSANLFRPGCGKAGQRRWPGRFSGSLRLAPVITRRYGSLTVSVSSNCLPQAKERTIASWFLPWCWRDHPDHPRDRRSVIIFCN